MILFLQIRFLSSSKSLGLIDGVIALIDYFRLYIYKKEFLIEYLFS